MYSSLCLALQLLLFGLPSVQPHRPACHSQAEHISKCNTRKVNRVSLTIEVNLAINQ